MNLPSRLYISTRFARHFSHGYTTFRSGRFGLSRFGLANSVWPIRSGRFGLAVSVTGHFGRDISVHKELMKFVNLAQVTSAQLG